MRRRNPTLALFAFALSSFLFGEARPTDASQPQDTIRSLEMKSRTDTFLQYLGHGQTRILQVVSYKFAPQIRVYEMGTANPAVRGVAVGELIASSLETETGRRETSDCQAFHYGDDRGNTVHGAEVHLTPLHDGPYIIQVTGSPTLASRDTKTFDYRIVIRGEEAASQHVSVPPIEITPPQLMNWYASPDMPLPPQSEKQFSAPRGRYPSTPAQRDRAQFPPGQDATNAPTAAEMLSEAEQLMRSLGLMP